MIRRPSRRSALSAAVCLCLPLVVSACGSTGGLGLFDLRGRGTLIVGHYTIPPVYRHLMLHWFSSCTGGSKTPGIRIDAWDELTGSVRSELEKKA